MAWASSFLTYEQIYFALDEKRGNESSENDIFSSDTQSNYTEQEILPDDDANLQGLDGSGSPPSSPPAYRRLSSREENVFSRLTSGTAGATEQPIGRGIISVYTGKVPAKAPLLCTHVAEGHSRAVLSVFATDDLLFSASKEYEKMEIAH
ncbi:hypothetical protein C0J52_18157 [Blattella germanica]|nr:hypothetical protein C0J52_18157 [Blattella germanica]